MNLAETISVATDFIAGEESFSPRPYWDVNGFAIGYGNHYYEDGSTVSGDDDPISEARGRELLSFYVEANAQAIANQVTTDLNPNQLAALTSLRYNCGTITNNLLTLINSGGLPESIAVQLSKTCTTSGGVSNPALIDRREREADLFRAPPVLASIGLVAAAIGLVVAFFVLRK